MRRLVVALDAAAPLQGAAAELTAAATLAELAGAHGVRLSVNEDLRGVSEANLRDVRRVARGFELRMPPAPGLVKVALEARPERVVLASAPRETRSSAPLDFQVWGAALAGVVRTLRDAGIGVSLLVAPRLDAVKAAHNSGADSVELYTGGWVDLPSAERSEALSGLADAGRLAAKLRMSVGLGGRLEPTRVRELLEAAPVAEWVSVGRFWVSRCFLLGIDRATRDLVDLVS